MKRAFVTGGTRGLGLAICRRLLDDGWSVVTSARKSSPELEALRAGHAGRLDFVAADLAVAGSVSTLAAAARLADGCEAFVSNAAVGTEGLLTLTREADLRACVEVNLVAPMLLARQVVKGMLASGRSGSLVFVASIAARTGFAGLTVYGATKGGLVSFSRALAREYGERGIRANCVLPGFLTTEMSASLEAPAREQLARRSALKRLGEPADVVGTVAFLLSEEARHITGTEVVVDGGMLA